MNTHAAYEVHGHRKIGEVCAIEVRGEQAKADALALAQAYADRWRCTVSLCRVPFENTTSDPWPADQVEVARQLHPAREANR